jgi:hypothetical protein
MIRNQISAHNSLYSISCRLISNPLGFNIMGAAIAPGKSATDSNPNSAEAKSASELMTRLYTAFVEQEVQLGNFKKPDLARLNAIADPTKRFQAAQDLAEQITNKQYAALNSSPVLTPQQIEKERRENAEQMAKNAVTTIARAAVSHGFPPDLASSITVRDSKGPILRPGFAKEAVAEWYISEALKKGKIDQERADFLRTEPLEQRYKDAKALKPKIFADHEPTHTSPHK